MGAWRLYKAGTPYNAVDLAGLDYTQTADVIYLAHLDYPPEKVTRTDHTNWTFSQLSFATPISAPVGVSATPTQPNTTDAFPITARYAVAAVSEAGQTSLLSAEVSASNDLSLRGNLNTVSWTAHADAAYYLVYKSENATSFGFIGIAETNAFVDGNGGIQPDYSDGPRVHENPFDSEGNYPSTVSLHQQRLFWARTRNLPNVVWGSQVADFENMGRTRPGKADDALVFGIVSDRVNSVNHLASLKSLIGLTSDGVFAINGGADSTPATAQQIVSTRQSGRGSKRLRPIGIDNALLYRPAQGSSIRALGYTFEIDGYKSDNIAIFSPHLFNGYGILAWAYQQEPFACVWAVRSDGKLLCLTWEQEQQVWGWTVCETNGTVEDVAVISEGGMDRCYLAVRRTLAGVESVFIERMALPLLEPDDLADCCYLDCALTQKTEVATNVVTNLQHLEGETVTAFADGYVIENLVVANGQVTLEFPATTITVGLPYSGEIETLPLALDANAHTVRQTITGVTLRVEKTRGLKIGPGGGDVAGELFEIKQRGSEPLDEPIPLATRDYEEEFSTLWSNGATMRVVQDYPLPATITALFPRWKGTK